MQLTQKQYYTAPNDEVFDDIKQAAMKVWKEVDSDNDKYGYATGKINRIKDLENIQDNYAYIVAMFDHENRQLLIDKLELLESKQLVKKLF